MGFDDKRVPLKTHSFSLVNTMEGVCVHAVVPLLFDRAVQSLCWCYLCESVCEVIPVCEV